MESLISLISEFAANKCYSPTSIRDYLIGKYPGRLAVRCEQGGLERVILSTYKTQNTTSGAINGVVLRASDHAILAVPPGMLNFSYDVRTIKPYFDKYEVSEVVDGTTMTLYYCADAWRISTANAYDAGNMKWLGSSRTYRDVLDELLAIYPEFTWNKLDPEKCYTLIARHHSLHKLEDDPQGVHVVCATSLVAPFARDPAADIGLPQIRVIRDIAYEDAIARCKSALHEFRETRRPFYGYTLRRDGADVNANLLMESSFMRYIRNAIYNIPKNRNRQILIAPNETIHYMSLVAYLRSDMQFHEIFPTLHKQYFAEFDKFIARLSDEVIKLVIAKNMKHSAPGTSGENTPISNLASDIIKKMTDMNVGLGSNNIAVIVGDLVRYNYEDADKYFAVLTCQCAK